MHLIFCRFFQRATICSFRNFLLVLIFFILTLHTSYGQSVGNISGYVADSTGSPLSQASIQLLGTTMGTVSDSSGKFFFTNVPLGKHSILVSTVGYQKKIMEIDVEASKNTYVAFTLEGETRRLDEVVLSSDRLYKKDVLSPSLRLSDPVIEIPQNITIIGKELIRDQQLMVLSEIERNVSGVTTNFPYPGIYTDFMIRGSRAENNKFRNGIQSAFGTQLMEDMSFVESVEFVKGPAGFMISQGEPGGIYNVNTKKPLRDEVREMTLSYGSFNLFRSAIDLGGAFKKNGKLLYRLNVMGQRSRTHIDYDYNNRIAVAPVVSYEFNNKTKLTGEYNFQQASLGIAEPSVFSINDYKELPTNFTYYDPSGDGVKLTDHTFYINLVHKINDDWKLTVKSGYSSGRWYGNRFDFDFSPEFKIIDNLGNMYRTYELRDITSTSTSGQLFLDGNMNTGSIKHNLLLGIDAANNSLSRLDISESVSTINIYDPKYDLTKETLPKLSLEGLSPYKESTNYSSFYIQDVVNIKENLRLTLAGRYTNANILNFDEGAKIENVSAFTPRAGLSYSIRPDLAVYALYDQSFIPQSGETLSKEKIKPLRGNNLEAGIKKEWFGNTLSTTLSMYNITKRNKLVTDLDPDFVIPLGEIQSKGLELDVIGNINKELSVIFNYAFTDSEITEDLDETIKGQRVDGVAKHATNFWLKYDFKKSIFKGLGFGIGGRYLSDRAALTKYADLSNTRFPVLDNWKQLDMSLNYNLDNLRFALNVNNITNEKNYTGVPLSSLGAFYTQYAPPVNYRISTSIRF